VQAKTAFDDLVFGVSGFRAIVGRSFEPWTITRLALAFAQVVQYQGGSRVVLGRDTRPSGEMARLAASSALTACGLEVIDVGVAPTPTVLHACATYDADGCLTITASHNPAEWNGIELALRRGRLLSAEDRDRLGALFADPQPSLAPWDAVGHVYARDDAVSLHIDRILAMGEVEVAAIRGRRPVVSIDACNGAGSLISPRLLQTLGCDVVRIHCEPTGRFPRSPEPSAENLSDLCAAVRESGADVGFAHDVDADRLVVVDETGKPLPEEYTFAFAADVVLGRTRRPLVTTVVTGGLLDDVAKDHGVSVVRTAVGVGNVVDAMRRHDASIGGESTGGVVLPGTHLTTDGIAAIAVILSGLARNGATVSEWSRRWRRHYMRRSKIELADRSLSPLVLDRLSSMYPDATIERIDGVRFLLGEEWVSVRPSGTEPVLRVFAESPDEARAESLVRQAIERVESAVGSLEPTKGDTE